MTDGEKEKIKLRATFVNGLAMGIMLIGAFTPITRAAYDPSISRSSLIFMALLAIVCIVLGFALHYLAARHVKGIDG